MEYCFLISRKLNREFSKILYRKFFFKINKVKFFMLRDINKEFGMIVKGIGFVIFIGYYSSFLYDYVVEFYIDFENEYYNIMVKFKEVVFVE